jgi:hypothetical protein
MKISKRERAKSVDMFMGNVSTSTYRKSTVVQDDDESTILEGSQRTKGANTIDTQSYVTSPVDNSATTVGNSNSVIGWIIGIVVVGIIGFIIFNSQGDEDNSGNVESYSNPVEAIPPSTIQSQETETKNKLVEAIQKANSEGSFLLSNNNQVYYLKDKMPLAGFNNTSSGCAHIYIYNMNNDATTKVNIRLPSGDDELQYEIDSYAVTGNKITFILYERGRNGYGVSNFSTEVAQYNTQTNQWRNIADGCAGAEFIEANRKIRLKFAEITNYDEVVSAADYQYSYTFKEISL